MQSPGFFKAGQKLLTAAAATGQGVSGTTVGALLPLDVIDAQGSYKTVAIQLTGISGDTVTWEGTVDGTTWVIVRLALMSSGTAAGTATANGIYQGDVSALLQLRANVTVYSAGTIHATANLIAF